MKLTKRKGFNFFRSYYDVYNELSDKDKIAFMDALLDRQFIGVKPKNLTGMAKFAYISQTNSIDSQVKGYEDKTKSRLNGEKYNKKLENNDNQQVNTPTEPPYLPPTHGGKTPPTEQVEEKGKEKEVYSLYTKQDFLKNWNEARKQYTGKESHLNTFRQDEDILFREIDKNFSKEDFHNAIHGLFKQESVPSDIMKFRPKHLLGNIETYIDAEKNKSYKLYTKS